MSIAFDEPGAAAHVRRLDEFDRLISSNLLEAELLTCVTAFVVFHESRVTKHESRPFFVCFDRRVVRKAGYVSPRSGGLSFATLDARQSAVTEALGFPVPWEASLS